MSLKGDVMLEQEVRYLIQTADNVYCTNNYKVSNEHIEFKDEFDDMKKVPLSSVASLVKETISKTNITNKLYENNIPLV